MDLTLGSAVIDRLLALPLSYRTKTQENKSRLGELTQLEAF